MADLTWDELKKVAKDWIISAAEKFGITEIRCHSNNITNVVLSLVNAEDDEERAKIMDFFITRLNVETFAMLNHLNEPRFFVKTLIIGDYDPWDDLFE